MAQLVQILGSLLILAAFIAAQRGKLSDRSLPYLLLNFVGSAVLTVLAAQEHQAGFFLLEASWALVSAAGVWEHVARRDRSAFPEPRDVRERRDEQC